MRVGLSQFYGIGFRGRGDNGNECGFGGGWGSGSRHPVGFPPVSTRAHQVRIPTLHLLALGRVIPERNPATKVTDECDGQRERLSRGVGQGKGEACRGHLARHLPVAVMAQRHKLAHLREGSQSRILIRLENGHHGAPLSGKLMQEPASHSLAVDDESCHRLSVCRLVIASQQFRNAFRQVQVAPVSGGQMGMAEGIMQQQQGTSAQHFACPPDEPARKQMPAKDGFAVSIHVEGWGEASRQGSAA